MNDTPQNPDSPSTEDWYGHEMDRKVRRGPNHPQSPGFGLSFGTRLTLYIHQWAGQPESPDNKKPGS